MSFPHELHASLVSQPCTFNAETVSLTLLGQRKLILFIYFSLWYSVVAPCRFRLLFYAYNCTFGCGYMLNEQETVHICRRLLILRENLYQKCFQDFYLSHTCLYGEHMTKVICSYHNNFNDQRILLAGAFPFVCTIKCLLDWCLLSLIPPVTN